MTSRVVVVLARPSDALPSELTAAMLADVIDLVADTPEVDSALAVAAGYDASASVLTWPGTPVVTVAASPTLAEILVAAPTTQAVAVAAVVPDAPDLPTLMLGKLFSALAGRGRTSFAVCPDDRGGLVAVAASLPIPSWLTGVAIGLDSPDGLDALRAAAPPGELTIGPGWHRVRAEDDLRRLDPGLEGWDATRAYLSG